LFLFFGQILPPLSRQAFTSFSWDCNLEYFIGRGKELKK
jgi:hypothetical protein